MFDRIRSSFSRKPGLSDEWGALRAAGYHDLPRYISKTHARDRYDREPMNHLHSLGHLR